MEKGIKLINRLIGEPPKLKYHSDIIRFIVKRFGIEALKKYYEDNLRIVLSYVAKLIKNLHGKIIITADHGELLGEYGFYEHACGKGYPELVEVPWLEIDRDSVKWEYYWHSL